MAEGLSLYALIVFNHIVFNGTDIYVYHFNCSAAIKVSKTLKFDLSRHFEKQRTMDKAKYNESQNLIRY